MLGVDTNVLVRFLADDDDLQSPMAIGLVSRADNQPVFLSMFVLAETFTVLERVKKFPRARIVDTFRKLAASAAFEIEDLPMLRLALDNAEAAGCGLADAIISLQNRALGCRVTATFDHRATRLEGMSPAEAFL